MSTKIDAVMSLLSDCDKKDLLKALQEECPEEETEKLPQMKLSMNCPMCGDMLQVLYTKENPMNSDLAIYYCHGVNPMCMCHMGLAMGETKVGEFKQLPMTEEDLKKIAKPVVVTRDIEYEDYDDEEDDEEEDEEEEWTEAEKKRHEDCLKELAKELADKLIKAVKE